VSVFFVEVRSLWSFEETIMRVWDMEWEIPISPIRFRGGTNAPLFRFSQFFSLPYDSPFFPSGTP
jgi:hypothetical protein